jgi:hypothetical protein
LSQLGIKGPGAGREVTAVDVHRMLRLAAYLCCKDLGGRKNEFVSTRGKAPAVCASEAIMQGLAPDGGLYYRSRFLL